MSESPSPNYEEIEKEAVRLRQRHEYWADGLGDAEDVTQRAKSLREQIAQSDNPEEEFAYEDRAFANGETTQNSMLQQAKLHYNANMWEAQQHYRDNKEAYVDLAKQDAEAAGVYVNTGHSDLDRPEMQSTEVGDSGEALEDARESAAPQLGGLAVDAAIPELESVENTEKPNPYERLSDEQLTQVRTNIAESVIKGIASYDIAEVNRAAHNLIAIQREFEERFAGMQPEHARGAEGSVMYPTQIDNYFLEGMTDQIELIDGAVGIIGGIKNQLSLDFDKQPDKTLESKLESLEIEVLLQGLVVTLKARGHSEFSHANKYSTRTNEDLAKTVDALKTAILQAQAEGRDATEFKENLKLVGAVMNSRKETASN